jgi:hypothetical protein
MIRNSSIDSFHSITFGCPAAHSMGFHDGGVRRIMQGLIPFGAATRYDNNYF